MVVRPVTVGTAQVTLCNFNEKRTAILVTNTHATAIVYLSDEDSVTTTDGEPLYPKQTKAFSESEGYDPKSRHVAISDTAGVTVMVNEQFLEKPSTSQASDSRMGGW